MDYHRYGKYDRKINRKRVSKGIILDDKSDFKTAPIKFGAVFDYYWAIFILLTPFFKEI